MHDKYIHRDLNNLVSGEKIQFLCKSVYIVHAKSKEFKDIPILQKKAHLNISILTVYNTCYEVSVHIIYVYLLTHDE